MMTPGKSTITLDKNMLKEAVRSYLASAMFDGDVEFTVDEICEKGTSYAQAHTIINEVVVDITFTEPIA